MDFHEGKVFQEVMNSKVRLEGIYGTDMAVKKLISHINNKINEVKVEHSVKGERAHFIAELEEAKQYLKDVYQHKDAESEKA